MWLLQWQVAYRKGNKWQQVPVSRDGFRPLHDYLTKHRPYLAELTGVDTANKEDAAFLSDDGKAINALWRFNAVPTFEETH